MSPQFFRFISLTLLLFCHWGLQQDHIKRQPSRDVLRKRCSENMQQIYWITPIANCDLNKVAKQLYWDHTSAWVFSCKFTSYFQSTFFTEHLRATNSEDRDLSVTSIKRDVGRCFLVNFWGKNCEKAPF